MVKNKPPKCYFRTITELEKYLDEKYRDRDGFKKLSKTRALAINTLRAKVRKISEEYKEVFEEYKNNPKAFETSDSEDSSYDIKYNDESDASSISKSLTKAKDMELTDKPIVVKRLDSIFDSASPSPEVLSKTLTQIMERRGRRGVDRNEQIQVLKKIAAIAKNTSPSTYFTAITHLINAEFDFSIGTPRI